MNSSVTDETDRHSRTNTPGRAPGMEELYRDFRDFASGNGQLYGDGEWLAKPFDKTCYLFTLGLPFVIPAQAGIQWFR